jgi:hypothetical protein
VVEVMVAVVDPSPSPRNASTAPALSASDIRTPPCKMSPAVHRLGDQGSRAITRSGLASSRVTPSCTANGMSATRSSSSAGMASVCQRRMCQHGGMADADPDAEPDADPSVEPVRAENFEAAVRFLVGWVSDGEADARRHLADHAGEAGASLAAVRAGRVIGIVAAR